jgi:tetratricopeptide (TPR) repeat protein
MGSWLGWVVILAGIYLLAIAVRGIIQIAFWLIEEFWPDYDVEEPADTSPSPGVNSPARLAAEKPQKTKRDWGAYVRWVLASAAQVALLHWLAAPMEFFRMLFSSRKYDYWVGAALAEDDPRKKVKYLSRALALNPVYMPGWGLKANALLALQRYEEALECCETILRANPNPLASYEKGLCCYHLGRFREAVQWFDKVLADGSAKNGKLRDNASHQKRLAEAQMNPNAMA